MDAKVRLHPATRGFFKTFEVYYVPDEWQRELYNYFIKGYPPGSFHEALFANDLLRAAQTSHVSNKWESICYFMKWVFANAPEGSWGSYENVDDWQMLTETRRRKICEDKGWMLTREELVWKLVSEENA